MSRIPLLTDADFEREVLEFEQPVLVEFSADWCGLGHMIAPVIEEMALRFHTRVKFCRIDAHRDGGIAARYGVQRFPVILFFKDGQVVDCIIGAASRRTIEQKLLERLEAEEETRGTSKRQEKLPLI